jgi:hypothetical protein
LLVLVGVLSVAIVLINDERAKAQQALAVSRTASRVSIDSALGDQFNALQVSRLENQLQAIQGVLYGIARDTSAAAAALKQDDPQAEVLAARAIECLSRLQESGFFGDPAQADKLRADKSFEVLQNRADFQKLLSAIAAPPMPEPPAIPRR